VYPIILDRKVSENLFGGVNQQERLGIYSKNPQRLHAKPTQRNRNFGIWMI